jgi:hypothetical protein
MTSHISRWFVVPLLAIGCAHSGGQSVATKQGGKSELVDEGPTSAQGAGNAAAPAAAASSQLVPFQSSGGFTVLMPPNPQQTDRSEQTAGGTVRVHVAQASEPTGKPTYVATYTEFPPGTLAQNKPKDVLDAVQQSTAQSVGGNVTSSQDIQVAGLPGREFTAQTGDGNVTARVLVGKERLYTLAGTYGQGPPPESLQRFLGSFSPTNAATGGSGDVGTSKPAPMSDGSASPATGPRPVPPTPRAPDSSSSSQRIPQ